MKSAFALPEDTSTVRKMRKVLTKSAKHRELGTSDVWKWVNYREAITIV